MIISKNYKVKNEIKPLVTIITINFNDKTNLEETILSVINQKFENFEYIIVDGGSTDGSLDIIRKYNNFIDRWVSEKDKGIYDAMNKGIHLASGEWINFLNSGDTFSNQYVFENIDFKNYSNYVLIYGSAKIFNEKKIFLKTLKPLKLNLVNLILFSTRTVCHQAVFYNTKISFLFPEKYKFKGELYSYFEYLKKGKVKKLDQVICDYRLGGLGMKNKVKNINENWNVLKDQVGVFRFLHLPFMIFKYLFK